MAEYIRQDHHLPHGSLEPSITNGDRLRMMADEEMASFMQNEWLDIAICNELNTTEKWLAWLRKNADLKTIRKTEENADSFQQK